MSNGPVPIGFGPGLSAQEVHKVGWAKKANIPTESIRTHEYRTAVKTGSIYFNNFFIFHSLVQL